MGTDLSITETCYQPVDNGNDERKLWDIVMRHLTVFLHFINQTIKKIIG